VFCLSIRQPPSLFVCCGLLPLLVGLKSILMVLVKLQAQVLGVFSETLRARFLVLLLLIKTNLAPLQRKFLLFWRLSELLG
ncbi:unnamed protein product, partial [Prunus brigantina]